MAEKWIMLGSSNSTKEYIADVLETIAAPTGYVMHFRYRKIWVDDAFWSQLPLKGEEGKNDLVGKTVLVVWLYAEDEIDQGQTKTVVKQAYPVRLGRIVECYRTGDSEVDQAHFYFSTSDYFYSSEPNASTRYAQGFQTVSPKYVYIRQTDLTQAGDEEGDFLKVVRSLNKEHFKYSNGKSFIPVFCCVRGFTGHSPTYNAEFRQAEYTLLEQKNQTVDATLYLYEPPRPDSKILWAYSDKQFAVIPRNEIQVAARYDELRWVVNPMPVASDEQLALVFRTEIFAHNEGVDVINVVLSFPIKVSSNRWRRFVTALIEALPGLAASVVASAGTYNRLSKGTPLERVVFYLIVLYLIFNLALIVYRTFCRWK